MLRALTIHNVVLIDRLEIDFRAGLCALTGETGAGKSIVLDSLGLALGARAESRLVRKGPDGAQVSARFEVAPDHPVFALLAEAGLRTEPGEEIILRRALDADGKSRAFINDQAVSAGLLKQAGDLLVEIHGQFDTHSLLNPARHIALLDEYAGLGQDVRALAALRRDWRAAEDALSDALARAEALRAEEEYLRHVVEELVKLAPEAGEEERLSALKTALQNRAHVVETLNGAMQFLGADGGADSLIQKAYRVIGRAEGRIGPGAQGILEGMDRASAALDEARAAIEGLFADMEEEGLAFEDVDDRLYALRAAGRKHECRVDALPDKRAELEARLADVEAQDDLLAGLSAARDTAARAYEEAARALSARRKAAAGRLDKAVMKELGPLKLDKARFVTQIEDKPPESWGEDGIDSVAFLIAANPGAAPGPLGKIASGGERARFMLALKVVMAATGSAGTLIFDEVDTGIGGAVAAAVGERLARLGATHQVMVVTHAPQVAARAAHHWIVYKSGGADVRTGITPLENNEKRREEIARMLSGAEITTEARAAAEKLLEKAA